MIDESTEASAKAAYNAWRRHFDHPTLWNELTPHAQVVWLNVAHAAIDGYAQVPDVNAMDRGFGNCPHCRSSLVTRCHECLNEIFRDEAHAAGWRMDHLSGFGCIALCPDHK